MLIFLGFILLEFDDFGRMIKFDLEHNLSSVVAMNWIDQTVGHIARWCSFDF